MRRAASVAFFGRPSVEATSLRRAHRDVAQRGRVRHLHQTRDDLAERAVAADAGHGVILRRVLRRHHRRVAAALREVHRRQVSAAVENVHHLAEAGLVAAASGMGLMISIIRFFIVSLLSG